jgi:predicted GNAT family acetyltransferase
VPTLVATRYQALADFLAVSGPWIAAREAEHNLMLGILGSVQETPTAFGDEPVYLLDVRDDAGRTVAAVIRTPPWRVVLSEVDDPAALEVLAARIAQDVPDVPGIVGPAEHVGVLAASIAQRLHRVARKGHAERAFSLRRVIPPRATPGYARLAGPADRALVLEWHIAFEREALGDDRPAVGAEERVDRALTRVGSRRIWLWDDGGPTSLVGVGGPTPTGIRVGPVYTPPELRGRGYASACVAAASQAALDEGRQAVYLFTDLANPTANHIYQAIGYEPVRDVDEWALDPPGS